MTHPSRDLDEIVHQRVRLGILAVLMEAKRADFAYLREALEVTDGNLSRHLHVLDAAGLVAIEKTVENRRPRTWIAATEDGRAAFEAEVRALREILARAAGASQHAPDARSSHQRINIDTASHNT